MAMSKSEHRRRKACGVPPLGPKPLTDAQRFKEVRKAAMHLLPVRDSYPKYDPIREDVVHALAVCARIGHDIKKGGEDG